MNKPASKTPAAVNPVQVEGAIQALATSISTGTSVALVDGCGLVFRCHPAVAEKLLANGYKRA